jgi:hypothetical protein
MTSLCTEFVNEEIGPADVGTKEEGAGEVAE